MANNSKFRNWQLSPLGGERRISCDSWGRGERELEYQNRTHQDYKCYGEYSRERHNRGGYQSMYHDEGIAKRSRGERVPKFHEEPRSRRARDQERPKGYEHPIPRAKGVDEGMLAAIMAKVDKMRNDMSEIRASQTLLRGELNMMRENGGGNTRQSCIPPRKADLSHPIRSPKVPFELSPDVSSSMSLIQSSKRKIQNLKCENVGHVVKECVNHRVELSGHGDEEPSEDEEESTATHEEELHSNPYIDASIKVESEEECKPLKIFKILSTEPKPHEVANGNERLREDREKEEKLESESMLPKPIECEKRLNRWRWRMKLMKRRLSQRAQCLMLRKSVMHQNQEIQMRIWKTICWQGTEVGGPESHHQNTVRLNSYYMHYALLRILNIQSHLISRKLWHLRRATSG